MYIEFDEEPIMCECDSVYFVSLCFWSGYPAYGERCVN